MGEASAVRVRISYLGSLRRRMGCKREELVLDPPATVRNLLDRLVEMHGEGVASVFFNQYGWIDPRLFFLVDTDEGVVRRDLDAQVADGEEVRLVLGMPMSGG